MKILLPLSHELHTRNMVASGLTAALERRGHQVELLTDLPPRWARLRRSLRLMTLVQGELRSKTYRHKATLRTGGQKVEAAVWRALRKRGVNLEDLAVRIEHGLTMPKALVRHLDGVDVVLWPTLIHMDAQENDLIKIAKLCGVPVVAAPATWDTLTTKSIFLVRPDRLLVWGDAVREQAISVHGFSPDQVDAPGPPHFWPYEAEISPRGRFVLVAGTSLHYWKDEDAMVAKLRKALDPIPVTHRLHPRRDPKNWNRPLDGVRKDLEQAFCVVAAFSTVVIEAALMGRPSILVGVGGNAEHGQALEHMKYDHMAEVARWPGVSLARSMGALTNLVLMSAVGDYARMRASALRIVNARPGIIARFCEALEKSV